MATNLSRSQNNLMNDVSTADVNLLEGPSQDAHDDSFNTISSNHSTPTRPDGPETLHGPGSQPTPIMSPSPGSDNDLNTSTTDPKVLLQLPTKNASNTPVNTVRRSKRTMNRTTPKALKIPQSHAKPKHRGRLPKPKATNDYSPPKRRKTNDTTKQYDTLISMVAGMKGSIENLNSTVTDLKENLTSIQFDLSAMQKTNVDLVSQLAAKTAECRVLDNECIKLRKTIDNHKSSLHENEHNKTLVIGSSIIRDFDESKMNNTDTVCISGGKITDVNEHLSKLGQANNKNQYKRIVIQIASNDCAKKDSTPEPITKEYKLLATCAKSVCDEVCISSICPRTDNEHAQQVLEAVNAELQVICEGDNKMTFINNDKTFRLQDGTINEGFLDNKGLHLSKAGTNSLARNMQLDTKSKDVTKPWPRFPRHTTSQNPPEANEWQTVNRRRHPKNPSPPSLNDNTPSSNRRNVNKPSCFKCGESSHLASTCWHPNSVRCHGCNQLGHKLSKCPTNSQPNNH
ncbi:unnamed protein product [Owenia fusiformis]|uniref:CCHC-type domain-containing protein n=1 Tax=Owenia fusiformis TaxID=6347 RepID=A0A8S4NR59_OWEFU|nr:unnamed protein product [Owenia fusiformis]